LPAIWNYKTTALPASPLTPAESTYNSPTRAPRATPRPATNSPRSTYSPLATAARRESSPARRRACPPPADSLHPQPRSHPRPRRRHAVEEHPRDRQPDPDDEAEQADDVDHRQPADALFPQLLEVGRQPDREERHHEEKRAE